MALKKMALQLGMGTDIEGGNHTKAAIRAVENALRRNGLVVADAFGVPRREMKVKIVIGAGQPDAVDKAAVANVIPYGQPDVEVTHGGMDTPRDDVDDVTIMVNAAVIVYLDLPEEVA
ncbi:MAG: Lin0512 family protein [Pseudomonadota bacterium]